MSLTVAVMTAVPFTEMEAVAGMAASETVAGGGAVIETVAFADRVANPPVPEAVTFTDVGNEPEVNVAVATPFVVLAVGVMEAYRLLKPKFTIVPSMALLPVLSFKTTVTDAVCPPVTIDEGTTD